MRMLAATIFLLSNLLAASLPSTIQDTQTPEEIAYQKEAPRLERLNVIAGQLHDPDANTAELMTEAARLCGFTIWNGNREKAAEPIGQPRLGYAIMQDEIKWFSKMQRAGHSVTLGNLIEALDPLYKGLGGDGSIGPTVQKIYKESYGSKNPSYRAWASFLVAVNRLNPDQGATLLASPESRLSPVEVLFLLRVLTEEITWPARTWLKKTDKDVLFAATDPPTQLGIVPGFIEDGVSATMMELFGKLMDSLEAEATATGASQIELIKKWTQKINAALSLVKFIETYATLECDFKVEAPGQPLIRSTNRLSGGSRTVAAHWYFDAPQLTDWLKDNRWVLHAVGIDPDAPHSGDLKGVETDWQIVRYTNILDVPVTMRGLGLTGPEDNRIADPRIRADPSKTPTDKDGVARVEFEGKGQKKDYNPNQVAPEEKIVQIQVTPQVKATTMSQDLVDAVIGALGIYKGITGGGLDAVTGFLTPVIESLYRLKWIGTKGYKLQVRDWAPFDSMGSITIFVRGYGSSMEPDGHVWQRIRRRIQYDNVVMEDTGVPEPPPLVLDKGTPPDVRQRAQQIYNDMMKAAARRPFIAEGPGSCILTVNDASGVDRPASTCGDPGTESSESMTTGTYMKQFAAGDVFAGKIDFDIGFAVTLDLEKMEAIVQTKDQIPTVTTGTNNSTGVVVTSTYNGTTQLLREIAFSNEGFRIPITNVTDPKTKIATYNGRKTGIKFSFGPNEKYSGQYDVVFRIKRVPKKP